MDESENWSKLWIIQAVTIYKKGWGSKSTSSILKGISLSEGSFIRDNAFYEGDSQNFLAVTCILPICSSFNYNFDIWYGL